jgi:PAS domain-containing protein
VQKSGNTGLPWNQRSILNDSTSARYLPQLVELAAICGSGQSSIVNASRYKSCCTYLIMCLEQKGLEMRQYLRTLFDTSPLPTFVVDGDVQIQDYNTAAAALLGPEPEMAFHRRGGDALGCIHAEAKGCGQSEPCRDCVIRNSVKTAIRGQTTHREIHKAELRRGGNTTVIDLLVTAAPLPEAEREQALVILEDVSELLTLRGLLPICCQCKKVRDDKDYWQSIDMYLHNHMKVKLTHGLCPVCFAEQIKAIESLRPAETPA